MTENNNCGNSDKTIVYINDVFFKSRRSIDWSFVEDELKKYIGNHYLIKETKEKIFIASDFPDEFSSSNDTKGLKGANMKAKANLLYSIGELIESATNKSEYPDYDQKHGTKAKFGWFRYDIYFGLPMYNDEGILDRYNIYSSRMLVRCDKDGKYYLYDFVRTKKETSKPLKQ